MTESLHKMDDDLVQRWSEAVAATFETLTDLAAVSTALRKETFHMIRIRVKPNHITIRIDNTPKQRYASAIHALHVIRVAIKEQNKQVEDTPKTQQALGMLVTRARDEFEAAIWDVDLSEHERAVCVARVSCEPGIMDEMIERSYYQTTDHRDLYVFTFKWGVFVREKGECIRNYPPRVSADDAIRRMGYVIAPVGATV